jgi:hypothetical protein
MAAAGPQDFDAIHVLQDKLQVTPLSAWGKPFTPPSNVPIDPAVDLTATPYDQVRIMTGESFFKRLAFLLKDNPPYSADGPALEKLKRLGIEPGKDYDTSKLAPGIIKGLNQAPGEVWLRFQEGPYETPGVNGWLNIPDVGHYGTDYNTRALIAWLGLGALTSEDCVYPSAFVDGDGNALEGTMGMGHGHALQMGEAGALAFRRNGPGHGGYGLFLSKGELGFDRGRVTFLYNLLDLKRAIWEGPYLEPGKHEIVFTFKPDKDEIGAGGTGVLSVDGKEVATNTMDHTTPITFPEDETFDISEDTRTGVALVEYRYDVPFKFTGKIDKLTFKLGPRATEPP